MTSPVRSLFALLASLVFVCIVLTPSTTRAHPPHAPFLNPFGEDTRFAPITSFSPKISIEVVADGMTSPLKGVAAPGLSRYLFVVDQVGTLWVVDLEDPNPNKRVFLDVRALLVTLGVCGPSTFDERGFLGVAFHPDFNKPGTFGFGKFYTYTSEPRGGPPTIPSPEVPSAIADHQNVISEWQAVNPANPAQGTAAGRRELMRIDWPQFNHDGGDLAFGPDRKLYISMGDGGGADDADGQPFVTAPPHKTPCGEEPIFGHQDNGNGQKLNTPLGKIHRIEVNPAECVASKNCIPSANAQYGIPADNPFVNGAVKEIWAFGFRNPYRFSFDRKTGDLYVGDVGQNDIEEVDIVRKGGNFGWNCKEGTPFFYINGSVPDDGFADESPNRAERPGDCRSGPRPFIEPIAQYDLHREGHSVIGGFVYYGTRAPVLRGKYVFGDFSLLFKFPTGPHDYGRLFTMNAHGHEDRQVERGRHGLRKISELMVVPGGAVSLAVLGIGQDTAGDIYVTGNTSGVPFPFPGNDERLGTEDDIFHGKVLRLVTAEDAGGKNGDNHSDGDDD
jgi:glucose/arabinose dehydrogenase